MIRKALIVYRVNRLDPTNAGIIRKLQGQCHGLTDCGVLTDYIIHSNRDINLNEEIIHSVHSAVPLLWFKYNYYNYINPDFIRKYDLIIIRYGLSTPSFIKWLGNIQEQNPKVKIIIDMPTYPYCKEWMGLKGSVVFAIDRHYRKKLKHIVHKILHSGPEKEIFGIKTIPFSNGIDERKIQLRENKRSNTIKLVAVGKWQYWHGLDRLLAGIPEYVRKVSKNIELNVIGNGPAILELKTLTQRLNIESYVNFTGVLVGRELEDYLQNADLGVGTLGLHRKGVKIDSSLKHRLYASKGLPFFMSGQESDFSIEEPFILTLPADDSAISVESCVQFINSLDTTFISQYMKDYSIKNLTWKKKMRKLLDQLNEDH